MKCIQIKSTKVKKYHSLKSTKHLKCQNKKKHQQFEKILKVNEQYKKRINIKIVPTL